MIRSLLLEAPDGVRTGARTAGDAGAPLVFVHGVGSTAAIWDAQLTHFLHSHQCAAVELRGNGIPKPEPDPQSVTRAGYAADVLTVADAFGFARFTLVGCSLGGVVAFELWKRAPERIGAMVIVGSFARYPEAGAYARRVSDAARSAGSMRAFAVERASSLGLSPERTSETIEQMACKSLDSYLAATQATWTGNYEDMLDSIDAPVLVCCGERDTVAPEALSRAIAAGIPQAQLHVIAGAGHVANADEPRAFNALLESFLASQPSTETGS